MRIELPLSGPSKQDRNIQVSSQMSINMYPAIKDPGAKSDLVMYSHPGLLRKTTIGLGPIRSNALRWKSNLYWISGSSVYKQDSTGTYTLLTGSLLTSGSRVVMDGGRTYFMITDGTYGYYCDGTTVTRITDADFPTPTHVAYIDGYFVVNDLDTDNFYINTTTEDPTAWAALDFATANARPDAILGHIVNGKDLYVIGDESTQIYFNSNNADFPFDSYPGAMPVGIEAAYSLVSGSMGVFFLATNYEGDKAIVRIQGHSVSVISDQELAWQINDYTTTSDAYAWVRRQAGMTFYEITFPAAGKTWSYNIDHGLWSQLKSYGLTRFRGAGYGSLGSSAFIGDYSDGRIYQLDFDTYKDDSQAYIRTRRTRIFHNKGLNMSYRSVMLDVDAGVGLITGQGSDPQVMMRYSPDGGHTWSSELWTTLGAIGEFNTKPVWNNLGDSRNMVLEYSCSDPVKFNLIGMTADIEVGYS